MTTVRAVLFSFTLGLRRQVQVCCRKGEVVLYTVVETSLRVKARHKTQSRTLRRKRNRVHPRGVRATFLCRFFMLCRRIANCTKFAPQ